jgi:hypothetical protein
MIIIGGLLQENPFFAPPDEFLRELQQRAIGRGSGKFQEIGSVHGFRT